MNIGLHLLQILFVWHIFYSPVLDKGNSNENKSLIIIQRDKGKVPWSRESGTHIQRESGTHIQRVWASTWDRVLLAYMQNRL